MLLLGSVVAIEAESSVIVSRVCECVVVGLELDAVSTGVVGGLVVEEESGVVSSGFAGRVVAATELVAVSMGVIGRVVVQAG